MIASLFNDPKINLKQNMNVACQISVEDFSVYIKFHSKLDIFHINTTAFKYLRFSQILRL